MSMERDVLLATDIKNVTDCFARMKALKAFAAAIAWYRLRVLQQQMLPTCTVKFIQTYVTWLHVYISLIFLLFKPASPVRLVCMNWELNYIYVSEFSCQVDDPIMLIGPYQFFGKVSFIYTTETSFTTIQGTVGWVKQVELAWWAGRIGVRIMIRIGDMFLLRMWKTSDQIFQYLTVRLR